MDQDHFQRLSYELSHRSLAQVIAETGAFVVIALAALIGNACVLYVFFKTPSFRTATNYYLITLALSDVAFSLCVMPVTIAAAASGKVVVGHRVGTGIGCVDNCLVFGSILTTSLIAVNRFFCVVKPAIYRKYFKPKPALIMIIATWIFSIFNAVIAYFSGMGTFVFFPGRFTYLPFWKDHFVEVIFSFVALFLLIIFPISVASVCYWNIYKAVQQHQNAVSSTLSAGPSTNDNRPSLTREEIHITRALLALVSGFVICWVPSATVQILSVFVDLPRHVEMIFIYPSFLSSAVNPIIFNIFNKHFRKQFLSIFCKSTICGRVDAATSEEQSAISLTDRN